MRNFTVRLIACELVLVASAMAVCTVIAANCKIEPPAAVSIAPSEPASRTGGVPAVQDDLLF